MSDSGKLSTSGPSTVLVGQVRASRAIIFEVEISYSNTIRTSLVGFDQVDKYTHMRTTWRLRNDIRLRN